MNQSLINYGTSIDSISLTLDVPENFIITNNTPGYRYTQESLRKEHLNYQLKHIDNVIIPYDILPNVYNDDNTHYTYCIDSFLAESIYVYMIILDLCKEYNIRRVIDIGCNTGIASILFNSNSIDYIGVDTNAELYFPYKVVKDSCAVNIINRYYCGSFPAIADSLKAYITDKTALISVHCMFYIIKESIRKQIESIYDGDYTHAIITLPHDLILDDYKEIYNSKYHLINDYQELNLIHFMKRG